MHALIEQHRDEIARLCAEYGVRRLDVFGSAGAVRNPYVRAEIERSREPVHAA